MKILVAIKVPVFAENLEIIHKFIIFRESTINNEIIIDRAHPVFFGQGYTDEEYYQLIRPLSGQDTITLVLNNTAAATTMGLVIYYI